MPLAVVGGDVAGLLQDLADRGQLGWDVTNVGRLQKPLPLFSRCRLRPVQPSGSHPSLEADPRGRTHRRRGIGVGKPHALGCQPFKVRRVEALPCGGVASHRHRQPIPGLIVGKHEHDIGLPAIRRISRKRRPRTHDHGHEHRRNLRHLHHHALPPFNAVNGHHGGVHGEWDRPAPPR